MSHSHRRYRIAAVTAMLALLAALLGSVAPASAAAPAVGNPGKWKFVTQGDFLNLAGTAFNLKTPVAPPECSDGINNDVDPTDPTKFQDLNIDYPADTNCASAADDSETKVGGQVKSLFALSADVGADGVLSNTTLVTNPTYIYNTAGLLTITITNPTPVTGSIDPSTGAVDITMPLKIRFQVSFADCSTTFTPHLTTAAHPGSPTVTPSPYDPATGLATVVDNTFAVPATTPTTGGADFCNVVIGGKTLNQSLNLPAAAGQSAAQFAQRVFPRNSTGTDINVAPTANAGPDQTTVTNFPVTLAGGGTDPDPVLCSTPPCPTPGPIYYKWTQTGGPAVTLSDPLAKNPTFTSPATAGDLTFSLQVGDGDSINYSPTTDTVVVHNVVNQAPTADAGSPQTVNEGATVNLSGTGSDPDNLPTTPATIGWSQVSGPSVTLTGGSTLTPSFEAPAVAWPDTSADVVLRLTVSDGQASTTSDVTITVTNVNQAPTADAGSPQTVNERTLVNLSGSGTDPDSGPSALTYSWARTAGLPITLNNANTSTPSFIAPLTDCGKDGSVTLQLTVSDGAASAVSSVVVTVKAVNPGGITQGDYTGDGKADPAVYNPATGVWGVRCWGSVTLGSPGDIPVPGDYLGIGKTRPAVYTPSTGKWRLFGGLPFTFGGAAGDIPVPADYNGDGKTDAAIFRPSTGQWLIRGGATVTFGDATAVPVPKDYDGNGTIDLAYYEPADGSWHIANGQNISSPTVKFLGGPGQVPVPGHYTASPGTQLAVMDTSTGNWYVEGVVGPAAVGGTTDQPAVADYDGNGIEELGRMRPAWWMFLVKPLPDPYYTISWGSPGKFAVNQPWAITHLVVAWP